MLPSCHSYTFALRNESDSMVILFAWTGGFGHTNED